MTNNPKMLIIYWTMTGNTRILADCLAEGAKQAGLSPQILSLAEATPDQALAADLLALGCPAMGEEELEQEEFAPFWRSLLPHITGKKLLLFGSYGWGGGAWLQKWRAEAAAAGAQVYDTLAAEGRPDDASMARCEALGAAFARS